MAHNQLGSFSQLAVADKWTANKELKSLNDGLISDNTFKSVYECSKLSKTFQ